MIRIEKMQTHSGYSFDINLEDGKFTIDFAGNLDLYWSYYCKGSDIKDTLQRSFIITKESGLFYDLIQELYANISDYDIYGGVDFLELDEEYREDLKTRLKEADKSNHKRLLINGIVDWHSDDYSYEDASRLLIEPNVEGFKITFVRGVTDMKMLTFAVRICNSGSRYNPFNVCFMNMYHKLVEYNPELENKNLEELPIVDEGYHQISINEYLDELKLTRKKDSQYEV